ncbi:MAG TPA: ADP/ATP-dependent (S)-NAD(P)H-hydrate dehydratase [Rhodoglobus sp.]|nr:ADP/ATP-dependent (S)-NAD(P)H-hydrate dehydratase [Rhodoglobus sp.]
MRWTPADAATMLRPPAEEDDKYSRGVLGVRTGSEMYPGAAVLSVEAALRTGVGMVRYLGPQRAADLVLQRRPEVVTADGRVQAWLLGSGMDAQARDTAPLLAALRQGLPTVLDGGALDLHDRASGPLILTPHHRELSRIVGADSAAITAEPERWAVAAAEALGATVLLKGHTTFVAGGGELLTVSEATPWLATAGAGDALGGILGALLATAGEEPDTVRIAATAAVVHGLASQRASAGGPLTVLDLCAAVPAVIADLLAGA